jgi:hypothetical protein
MSASCDNRHRAERARTALQAYIEAGGETFENSSVRSAAGRYQEPTLFVLMADRTDP